MNWRVVVENILILIVSVALIMWLFSCTFVKIEGDGATVQTTKTVKKTDKPLLKKVFPP